MRAGTDTEGLFEKDIVLLRQMLRQAVAKEAEENRLRAKHQAEMEIRAAAEAEAVVVEVAAVEKRQVRPHVLPIAARVQMSGTLTQYGNFRLGGCGSCRPCGCSGQGSKGRGGAA